MKITLYSFRFCTLVLLRQMYELNEQKKEITKRNDAVHLASSATLDVVTLSIGTD